jgi:hypothetical protein
MGGGGAPMGGGAGGAGAMMEGKMSDENYEKLLEKLVYGSSKESDTQKEAAHAQIIQENNEINDSLNNKALQMIDEINGLLENKESINTVQKINESENTDIVDIENIDLEE